LASTLSSRLINVIYVFRFMNYWRTVLIVKFVGGNTPDSVSEVDNHVDVFIGK